MATSYDIPGTAPLDMNGGFTVAWLQWITRTHNNARTIQESGVTADRPTTTLWVGRSYFDTTLGKPIWVKSIPAKPAAAVWCDATGAAV